MLYSIQYGVCGTRGGGQVGQVSTGRLVFPLPGKLCSVARINSQDVGTPGLQGCRRAIILELSWYQTCDDRIERAMGMAACKRYEHVAMDISGWSRWRRIKNCLITLTVRPSFRSSRSARHSPFIQPGIASI